MLEKNFYDALTTPRQQRHLILCKICKNSSSIALLVLILKQIQSDFKYVPQKGFNKHDLKVTGHLLAILS